jgi:hypothetical protein
MISSTLDSARGAALRSETVASIIGQKSHDLDIILVASTGEVLAASTMHSGSPSDCERVAAVVASVAVEYTAMEAMMGDKMNGFSWTTERRLIRCVPFCNLRENGSVFLISTLATSGNASINLEGAAFLKHLSDRVADDLRPCLSPILQNMVATVPPSE